MIYTDQSLDKDYINKIQKVLYKDKDSMFPWFLDFDPINNTFKLFHNAIIDQKIVSPFAEEAKNILNRFAYDKMIKVEKIYNIKSELYNFNKTNTDLTFKTNNLNTLIYFVNQSDLLVELNDGNQTFSSVAGRIILIEPNSELSFIYKGNESFQCLIIIEFDGHIPHFIVSDRVPLN